MNKPQLQNAPKTSKCSEAISSKEEDRRIIKNPIQAARILREYIGEAEQEHGVVITLNAHLQVTKVETIAIGSLSHVEMHMRDIFRSAVRANAHSIILGHNHPSGDKTPSSPDIEITKRAQECGEILGIPVLDHIVVTEDDFTSIVTECLE